jgi:hypothetical protein
MTKGFFCLPRIGRSRLLILGFAAGLLLAATPAGAQRLKSTDVPAAVKSALASQYPAATGVNWEKEKGNYEANWGGRSKEDNSVVFAPDGRFVEKVVAIPISSLPPAVATYVREHYPGARITEAGKVTNAAGETRYEAEVKGRDLVFDAAGKFLNVD